MRHRWALAGLLLVAPACAAILGIDEGTPREDGGVDATIDLGTPDVAPFDAVVVDVVAEAEAGPPPLTVPCGDAGPCVVGQTVCCRKGGNNNLSFSCLANSAACTGGTNPQDIPCDRAEVCVALDAGFGPDGAAPVCCADTTTNDSGTFLNRVVCMPQQQCLNTGVQMCTPFPSDGGGFADSGCVAPRTCRASQTYVPGYGICL